jgi:thioesterase domain-containing protein
LNVLFQAPTAHDLSRWLEAAMGKTSSRAQLTVGRFDQAPPRKCLVSTQPNGSSPPLFLITGYMNADDTLHILSNLIPYLGSDHTLCGLRPRWLDGHSPPYSSVKELVEDYLTEVRAFQPRGPYYLVGDCVGGVAAVELAQTLIEQGDEVALLVLLDTERPQFHSILVDEIARLWDLGKHIADTLWQCVRPLEGTRMQTISAVVQSQLRRAGLSRDPLTSGEYIYRQRTPYRRLLKKHRLKPYPGRINLILSDDVFPFVGLLGWNGYVEGGLEVSRTPGNHQTFRAQYSKEFGQRLRLCVDQARSENEQRMTASERTSVGTVA